MYCHYSQHWHLRCDSISASLIQRKWYFVGNFICSHHVFLAPLLSMPPFYIFDGADRCRLCCLPVQYTPLAAFKFMCVAKEHRKSSSSVTSILLIFNIWVYLTFIHRNIHIYKLPFCNVFKYIRVILAFLSFSLSFHRVAVSMLKPFINSLLLARFSSLFASHERRICKLVIAKFYSINFIYV